MSRRVVMCLSLVLMLGVVASLLLTLGGSVSAFDGLSWATSQAQGTPTPAPPPRAAASNARAIYQGDPSIGWDSTAQYHTWWPSACSPAALTVAMRAWGAQVGIGEVLDHLITLNAITPEHGLLHADALTTVAQEYGFQAVTFWNWTLDDVAHVTSQGVPVLVDIVDAKQQTPYPGFVVGHWLVVVGVSANQVQVRDSSGYHIHTLSPGLFHILATGIGVVLWQGASISLP